MTKNNTWQSNYIPPHQKNWTGRPDSLHQENFSQIIQCVDLSKNELPAPNHYCLLGFACDEGIIRNFAEPGARFGPIILRQHLGKLCNHLPLNTIIYDGGDIECRDHDLETAQQYLADLITLLLENNVKPIVIGGGHETAWGHFLGISQYLKHEKIGIINFDAHYDLRPLLSENKGTSGTPFLQAANYCKSQNVEFSYLCIGVQEYANVRSLYDKAQELNVTTIHAREITDPNSPCDYMSILDTFINKHNKIYVSVCLDVLIAHAAPGVCAPQSYGLWPEQVVHMLRKIIYSNKIISFDIVELSPPLDHNSRTARLTANLLADYFHTVYK